MNVETGILLNVEENIVHFSGLIKGSQMIFPFFIDQVCLDLKSIQITRIIDYPMPSFEGTLAANKGTDGYTLDFFQQKCPCLPNHFTENKLF